ncbi:acyltransferase family protein [Bradyrhizobium sp. SEMIA]|uniref:acyltransferase family protein n=1 Tax=Bradyrhizobium sp. SEMIA TaxID=2597515 RepID=UPI0022407E48|nr:acyltransferase [Bradyrhizobium sp. SEMIA]
MQVLRGFAALAVVVAHGAQVFAQRTGYRLELTAGESGVDLFFAISGFVMVVVTAGTWGKPHIAGSFLARRIIRIVPLYWAVTLLKCFLMLLLPALIMNTELSIAHLTTSLLFIPGLYQFPILQVGWTLSFEMLFYLLFAAGLVFTSRPVWLLSGGLTAMVLVGALFGRNWGAFSILANPMLIEFVFGMLIGLATVRGKFMPAPISVAILLASLGALCLSNLVDSAALYQHRLWVWGMPSAIVLAAVVSLEAPLRGRNIRPLVKLGDASYSLYLIHALVIGAVWSVSTKVVPLNVFTSVAIYVLATVASVVIAWIIYQWMELPVTSRLTKWWASRRAVATA